VSRSDANSIPLRRTVRLLVSFSASSAVTRPAAWSSGEKRTSETAVATEEMTAKFVLSRAQLAPNGVGEPRCSAY
jgi:hypothetical protein